MKPYQATRPLRTLALLAAMLTMAATSFGQAVDDLEGLREIPYQVAASGQLRLTEQDLTVRRIEKVIVRSGGQAADEATSQPILQAFGVSAGDSFDAVAFAAGLAGVRGLAGIADVKLRMFESRVGEQIVVVLEIVPAPAQPAPTKIGVFLGMPKAFPVLYQDRKSLLLAGGMFNASAFTGLGTWFGEGSALNAGNPLAKDVSGDNAIWAEGFGTLSLTGITTLNPDLYAYFQSSILGGGTIGREVYDSDTRGTVGVELANAGLAYAKKSSSGDRQAINFRVGRQNYVLGEGLQIVGGAGNGGVRGNLFLIPRQAFEESALLQFRWNDVKLEGFSLNPNETPETDTETRIEGANLEYQDKRGLMGAVSYLRVPESKATYLAPDFSALPREGLRVWNARARVPLGRTVTLAGEYVGQSHDDFKMNASAWVGTLTHRAANRKDNPAVSYRYALLSGDNPNTRTYERFDPLFGGGTIDTWANSFNFAFAITNANLELHRLRYDTSPNPQTKLSFQYSYLRAARKFNAGGVAPLTVFSSRDLGQEIGFAGQYFLNQNTVLIAAAAHSIPGSAFRDIDARKSWTYLQFGILYAF